MRIALIKTFFRSFFIQGCWNFEGMQNVGFAFGISPVLLKTVEGKKMRSKALLNSLELFNTHPYMATAILGAAAGMERAKSIDDGKDGKDGRDDISEMKKMLSGPLAGLGDSFFWAALKPLFSIIAVISGFMNGLIAPVVFIILYNSVHIWIRIKGFLEGVKHGIGVVNFFQRLKLPLVTERLSGMIVIITGVLLAGLSFFTPHFLDIESFGFWRELRVLLIVPFFIILFARKKGVSLLLMLYIFSFISVVVISLLG